MAELQSNPGETPESARERPAPRLLLVDDEPADLKLLEEILAPIGCKLTRAASQEEAMRLLGQTQFTAVVMDAAMPTLPVRGTPIYLLCDPGLKAEIVLRGYPHGNADCFLRPLVPALVRARISVVIALEHKVAQVATLIERERMASELHRGIFEEQSLRRLSEASARNLRALSETLPQQVWSSDPAGQLTSVNSVVTTYFDRKEKEVLGDGWLGVLHPDDVQGCIAAWTRSLQTGEVYQIEFRLRRFDGAYRWHLGRARPLRDADGQIVSWIGTNTDIDDQIRLREKMEESARSFQALAETIPQLCWAASPSGVVDYYNQQWIEYTGEGKDPDHSRTTWASVHDPAFYPLVVSRWKQSLASGTPFEMEMPLRRASDGEYRMHLTRALPLRDSQGRIVRWFGTSTDIHEQRKQVLKQLEWEARERQLRHVALRADVSFALTQRMTLQEMLQSCCAALVTHIGAAFARVWTLNAAGDTLELQASAGMYTHINGGHARVPVGKFKIGLIAEERRAHLTNDVQSDERVGDREWAKREGLTSFAGYPLIASDKLVGVIAMFARRHLDLEAMEAISSVADVVAQGIARKQVEVELELHAKELARSNAELERFSYIASHDLQEPLRMVASYTQLLGRRYKGKLDKDADEFIAFAVDGAQRMQTLINDLLAFSRVQTKPGEMSAVGLETVLQTALLNLRGTISERKAVVTHDPLPVVLAYDRQLTQLFQNLIGNAIKFGNAGEPRVHIRAQPGEDNEVRISVQDNGIGIDPAFFDRLFVVFQRLHNRSEYPGNGIGLAICKKIVERHGGKIWVESKPGEGATFFFTLKGPTP